MTINKTEPTARQIRLILALRKALIRDPRKIIKYQEAANLLHDDAALSSTPEELEDALKADVRHRWELHLPQIFRPVWGVARNDPADLPRFISVRIRLRNLTGDHEISPVPDETRKRLTDLIREFDFVEFQRFVALLFDELGYFVRSYGMGYRHGTDVWVAALQGGDIEEIIVEAKCSSLNASEAAKQVQGYVKDHRAHRGIIAHNREVKANQPGVELWDLNRIVAEMLNARVGIYAAGEVDMGLFHDLCVNFSAS